MDGELLGPDVRVALLGAEGSGKTCLSHTLVGKDYQETPPTEGADHMEIVVESTADWRPLTDEQKLDDLEKQKCLEAMYMSATRRRQPVSVATSSYMSSALPVLPTAITPSTQPHYSAQATMHPFYLPPTSLSSIPPFYSGPSYPVFQSIPPNLLYPSPCITYPYHPSSLLYPADFSSIQPYSSSTYLSSGPSQSTSASVRTPPPKPKRQKLPATMLSQNKTEFFSIKRFQNLKAIREPYNPKKKYINIWDFAGQEVFQHTHGIFVSEHVVCLIVFDASLSLDEVPE